MYHYTELLVELVRRGEIEPQAPLEGVRVTYHDPCYLARYNRITDAPRELMRATGVTLLEMPRNGTNTFCCGAGGGRIWMDDSKLSERPSEQRIREAQSLGELDWALYITKVSEINGNNVEAVFQGRPASPPLPSDDAN